jgi:preprotein translocase subunit SecB
LSPEHLGHGLGQLVDVRLQDVQFRRSDDYKVEEPLTYAIATSSDVALANDLTSGTILFSAEVVWRSTEGVGAESMPGPFALKLTLEGEFALNPVGDGEDLSAWIEFNSEHLLWPYLRAQIAYLTTMAGLQPMTIFTIEVPIFEFETDDASETLGSPHDVANG